MFHKKITTDYTNFTKMRFWIGVFCVFFAVTICFAQDSPSVPSEDPDQQQEQAVDEDQPNQGEGKYSTYDVLQMGEDLPSSREDQAGEQQPIPVPIQETKSLGAQPYVDDVFQQPRNRWGFSIAAYYGYIKGIYTGDQPSQSSWIGAVTPRTFLNFGGKKSQLNVDLGAGYRRYNVNRTLDNWDYYGNARYTNRLSKNVTFELADQFTSSYNDAWSFISLSSPINYYPDFGNEVLFNRQRINRNSLTADLRFQVSRKARLGVFGAYRYYDYSQSTLSQTHAYEAGASFDFKITDWLYLTNRYSAYLNDVNEQFRNAHIHRLQVGGLDFRLTRSWRIWAGGGIEYSDWEGGQRFHESVDAGIGYTSEPTTFSVTYQRGFTSAIGLSTLLSSDVISALYGRRITRWMRGSLQSYYYRSSELSGTGVLRTFSSGAELEFALRRDLVASLNGFYQNQNTRNFSIHGLGGINRISAYVGLQYFWPPRRVSDKNRFSRSIQ